ncbi:uncharacterized protein PG986_002174 [Apiospora aurea]|uniref:NACHT-NTPase and P-loop NTPases N-terminal domain-containing protein n=1 Tax=Apiospora aurea TaxID=335848 RepID=A0ABR1QYX3_9PEZI
MAEVVGLTPSVIGIAELATKTVATSFKVKSLLEQVSNVPEELQPHLDQIQLFSPLLATHINDDGPPALRGALGVAMIQCQQAADSLGTLAENLHKQVHEGSKAKRKLRAARIVLQKDTLASHEKRLSSAMQMLRMACQMYGLEQQRYLIDLQKRQPDIIVTQLLASLPAPPDTTLTSSQSTPESMRPNAGQELSRNGMKERRVALWSQQFWPDFRLGLSNLTGSLEVMYSSKGAQQEHNDDFWDLRLRTKLPRWFSSSTLDSIVRKSHAGWNYHLHTSNLHPVDSTAWELMTETMRSKPDSLQKLKSLIAQGQISVYDTKQIRGSSLVETMMQFDCEFYDASSLHGRLLLAAMFTEDFGSAYPGIRGLPRLHEIGR